MISIKHFLEQRKDAPGPDRDIFEALRQMGRLLLDGIGSHTVRGPEADFSHVRGALRSLGRQIEQPKSAMGLLACSSDVVEALENHCYQTTEYLREEKEQMQSMVGLLTDTLADLSGQTESSASHLMAIESELELASGLSDIRAVRLNLESCLKALRETVAHQRSSSAATAAKVGRALQDRLEMVQNRVQNNSNAFRLAEIDLLPEHVDESSESASISYVAAFKLQRAEHIASRFGESATRQMLSTLGNELKAILGPDDRLLRWKGASFLMFFTSTTTIGGVRARLAAAVAKIGMQYIEVGRKSALLAVGVDWIAFPQSAHPTLESALGEVENFLATGNESSAPVTVQR
jgi:GGDEF domain-containing protein